MDPSKSTRGRHPLADITNTTPQANQAPRGWRLDDVDPNARKRLRDRERSATMSDEKRMERNKKHRERYMINKVVDKDNSHLAMQLEVVGGGISMVKDKNDDWLHRGHLDDYDEWLYERDLDGNDDLIHVSDGGTVLTHEDGILGDMRDSCVDSCISPVVGDGRVNLSIQLGEGDHSTGTGLIPVEQTVCYSQLEAS
ncbi:uncharacterized protein LOC101777045 isoform X3 [Setaria italica]|uniref:uncharacterized protein LOC101777045 isoform X3 n=1 Tax=Setaria italica TaxID=4555 RepID=UPI000350EA18|nr:uncharacterized protein LOC101777045 isoform X3 [Setaria italica]